MLLSSGYRELLLIIDADSAHLGDGVDREQRGDLDQSVPVAKNRSVRGKGVEDRPRKDDCFAEVVIMKPGVEFQGPRLGGRYSGQTEGAGCSGGETLG
jgi:hypothetical protein